MEFDPNSGQPNDKLPLSVIYTQFTVHRTPERYHRTVGSTQLAYSCPRRRYCYRPIWLGIGSRQIMEGERYWLLHRPK